MNQHTSCMYYLFSVVIFSVYLLISSNLYHEVLNNFSETTDDLIHMYSDTCYHENYMKN